MWIQRQNTEPIEKAVRTRPSVLLTGVRQAGKSTLLKKLFPEAEYVTLDKIVYADEAQSNPAGFLARFKGQVIIDEVQYAPSLLRELKILIDDNRNQKGKWILTGSQQFALMEKVSESLAGRIRILNLGSLNAEELNNAGFADSSRDYLWKGGYPELWAENLDAPEFYEDYIQTYLERDLKQILNISNLYDFRRFMSLLVLRTGQLVKYSSISKELGVSVNTIKSWVNTLEIAGLVILLPPYFNNLGKRLIKTPKLYFCDNGLAASLFNITNYEEYEKSLYRGNLWENFVFTELIKSGYMPGKQLFYFRDQNGVEMDFILEAKGKTTLIEAKHNERPKEDKLNFRKIAPLFDREVDCVVACGIWEKGLFALKDYSVFNPMFGMAL